MKTHLGILIGLAACMLALPSPAFAAALGDTLSNAGHSLDVVLVSLAIIAGAPVMADLTADFEKRDFDACSLHLRSIGAAAPKFDIDVRNASWSELHESRAQIRSAARKVLSSADGADANADELSKRMKSHDVLMAAHDVVQDEIDERDRKGTKEPLDREQRYSRHPFNQGGEAYGDGTEAPAIISRSGWTDREGNELRVLAPDDRLQERSEYRGPQLGSILRAMITGPRNDAERRALAEGTDAAGGYTVPTALSTEFIDKLRAASVCIKAGARTVPMTTKTLRIAKLTGDPTVDWREESASIAENDATFAAVDFEAKSLMGIVKVTRELLEDSINITAVLEKAFVEATALKFDQGCLFGTGSGAQPTGLVNTAGIGSVSMGTNGAALADYDKLIDAVYAIQAANAGNPNALVFHPRTGASLAKLKDTDGNPLRAPEMISKVTQLPTTSVSIAQTQGTSNDCSSLIVGDFTKMLIGLRSMLRIEVLKERYAENNMYGFVWGMRGDVQLEHAAAFSKLVGIKP